MSTVTGSTMCSSRLPRLPSCPTRVLPLHVEELDAELLVQHDTTNELQQEREEEVGHREPEVGERRGRVVEHRVLPHRAHHADEQSQHHREHHRGADEQERVPGRLTHHVGHRAVACGTSRPSRPARSRPASRGTAAGRDSSRWYWRSRLRDRLLGDAGPVAESLQRVASARRRARTRRSSPAATTTSAVTSRRTTNAITATISSRAIAGA